MKKNFDVILKCNESFVLRVLAKNGSEAKSKAVEDYLNGRWKPSVFAKSAKVAED